MRGERLREQRIKEIEFNRYCLTANNSLGERTRFRQELKRANKTIDRLRMEIISDVRGWVKSNINNI